MPPNPGPRIDDCIAEAAPLVRPSRQYRRKPVHPAGSVLIGPGACVALPGAAKS